MQLLKASSEIRLHSTDANPPTQCFRVEIESRFCEVSSVFGCVMKEEKLRRGPDLMQKLVASCIHHVHIEQIPGGGGALEDATPFVRRVAGSNLALVATLGPWASPSLAFASGASA